MDEQRFDALARHLARGTSRRRALGALAVGALGLFGGMLGERAGAKACLREGKDCKRGSQCCSGRCQGKKGRKKCRRVPFQSICTRRTDSCTGAVKDCGVGAEFCVCNVTTSGAALCSQGFRCPAQPCRNNPDCVAAFGEGWFCVRSPDGCMCDDQETSCVQRCPDPV